MSILTRTTSIKQAYLTAIILTQLPFTLNTTHAQTAFFSIQGQSTLGTDTHQFPFILDPAANSTQTLQFQTFHHDGGTNAAGQTITATAAMDPILDLLGTIIAPTPTNDNGASATPGTKDALLSWAGLAPGGDDTPLPSPLPADNYTLELTFAPGAASGTWAVDMLGPANDMTFILDSIGTNPGPSNVTAGNAKWSLHNLAVGIDVNSTVDINASSQVSSALGSIGFNDGITGTVTVDNSTWTNTSNIAVGSSGIGHLNINNSATIDTATSTIGNEATATGTANANNGTWTNSSLMIVGRHGTGNLNINTNATVSNTFGIIGDQDDGTGTVNVNGGTWTNSENLLIGSSGQGTMTIGNTGAVSNAVGQIGFNTTATGTATVNDGTWTNTSALIVGQEGTGTLNINTGATVTNPLGTIALNPSATGTVNVNGGTWTNTSALIVAQDGTGTLNINTGATVTNPLAAIALNPGSTGTVNVDGGTWSTAVDMGIGTDGTLPGGNGTLNITAGGHTQVNGNLAVSDSGTVNLNGGTLAVNTITLTPNANINLNFGSLILFADTDIAPPLAQTTGPAASLIVLGDATLTTPLTVDGGTFSAASIVNPLLLDFKRGTVALTSDDLNASSTSPFGDALVINKGQTVRITNNINIDPGASLTLNGGRAEAEALTNDGLVDLADRDVWVKATTTATNNAQLQGSGNIDTTLNNTPTGTLRVGTTDQLTIHGPANTNAGRINLLGGLLHYKQDLTNTTAGPGLIIGNGTLQADAGLTNQADAVMTFSGTTNILGDVINNTDATIVSSGGGPLTFFDDVINNGTIRTSEGSFTTFFGTTSGSGTYPGTGTVNFEGDFTPGSSPGTNTFGGDVVFGPNSSYPTEVLKTSAPPVPGADNDHAAITGNVTLNGTLQVIPLPTAGQITDTPLGNQYTIMTFTTRTPTSFYHTITGSLINTSFALAPLLNETTNEFTLRTTIPGDLNLDNKVSVADLSTFALNFNTTPGLYNEATNTNSWQLGDFNTDGAITVADLSLLALNFGFELLPDGTTTAPTPLSIHTLANIAGIDPTTIPEPTTAAILTIAGIAATTSRRRD